MTKRIRQGPLKSLHNQLWSWHGLEKKIFDRFDSNIKYYFKQYISRLFRSTLFQLMMMEKELTIPTMARTTLMMRNRRKTTPKTTPKTTLKTTPKTTWQQPAQMMRRMTVQRKWLKVQLMTTQRIRLRLCKKSRHHQLWRRQRMEKSIFDRID